jgi:hypothetical protein
MKIAEDGKGRTMYETIVDIIEEHDHIELELK